MERRKRKLHQFPFDDKAIETGNQIGFREAGFAGQVAGRDSLEFFEPSGSQRPFIDVVRPEFRKLQQRFRVPSADFHGRGLQHLTAAERPFRRRIAQHERLSPGCRRVFGEE